MFFLFVMSNLFQHSITLRDTGTSLLVTEKLNNQLLIFKIIYK